MKEFTARKVLGKLKEESGRILYLGIGLGVGYLVGVKLQSWKFNAGLNRCMGLKPELEPMLKEAIDLCNKK